MPSIYDLKPRFQSLLRPLTRILAGFGVTAGWLQQGGCGRSDSDARGRSPLDVHLPSRPIYECKLT